MSYNAAFTAKRKADFLEGLKNGQSVCEAAKPLLITRRTIYLHKTKDPKFAEAWDRALEDGADKLEDEARRRAYEGVDEPVFYKGSECGYVRKYSDTLLIFLLKGARPEKYRETERVNITVDLNDMVRQLEAGRQRVINGYSAATVPSQLVDNNGTYDHALDSVSSVEGQVIEAPATRVTLAGGPPTPVESETPPEHES